MAAVLNVDQAVFLVDCQVLRADFIEALKVDQAVLTAVLIAAFPVVNA